MNNSPTKQHFRKITSKDKNVLYQISLLVTNEEKSLFKYSQVFQNTSVLGKSVNGGNILYHNLMWGSKQTKFVSLICTIKNIINWVYKNTFFLFLTNFSTFCDFAANFLMIALSNSLYGHFFQVDLFGGSKQLPRLKNMLE